MKLSKILLSSIVLIFLCLIFNQYWPYRHLILHIIWGGVGFGSELNQILLALAYSVSTKRKFLIDDRQWNYGNFNDYFHLPSTNYYPQLNRTFLVENNSQNDLIEHLQTTRVGTQVVKFWRATQQIQTIEIKRRVAHYLWKSISNETFKFIETLLALSLSFSLWCTYIVYMCVLAHDLY
jgi:hypothetical protein